jgi:hypothetical protein
MKEIHHLTGKIGGTVTVPMDFQEDEKSWKEIEEVLISGLRREVQSVPLEQIEAKLLTQRSKICA